jgi:Tol biopolymer transport system component
MVRRSSIYTLVGIFVLAIILAACGNGASTPASSPAPVSQTASTAPTAAAAGFTIQPYQPTISVPPDLNLSGKLIFADYRLGIGEFDFSTGEIVPIYRPPTGAYIGAVVLSPDGQTLLMAYTPPPDPNNAQYIPVSSLYTLPAGGSGEPSLLLADTESADYYYFPWWSPDGRYIYCGRYISPMTKVTPAPTPGYYLTRYTFPDGAAQDLLQGVLAARISADGTKMFYISMDLTTLLSNVFVADPDGGNSKALLPGGNTWIADSLAVAPDADSVIFSSSTDNPQPGAQSSWLDRVLGVHVAEAHNVPSDLWIVRGDGSPEQVTHLGDFNFVEDFSPDGQYVVFACGSGVYIVKADGSGLVQIFSEPFSGTVQWVP